MAKTLELWSPETIEEALGADSEGVLPKAVRLSDWHVRLPRHQMAMLQHFAERDQTTVSVRMPTSFRGWGSRRRYRGRMQRRGRNSPAEVWYAP